MRVAGELPDRQRQPGVDQQLCRIASRDTQQEDQRDHGECVERRDHQLHAEHARRCDGSQREDRLCRGRINRGRICGAVDVRIHRRVSQKCELIGGRHVPVRIDARKLHAAIPHVAVDIGRQDRWRGQGHQPHRHGDAKHQPDRMRRQTPTADDRHREQPQPACEAETGNEHGQPRCIGQTDRLPAQQPQSARHQTNEQHANGSQHRQATHRIGHCAAKLRRPRNPLPSIHALVAGAV